MAKQAYNSVQWRELRRMAATIARRDDTPCCRCGQPIDYAIPANSKWGLTIDHLVPIAIGGDLLPSLEGLAPAHRVCNSRYGAGIGNQNGSKTRDITLGSGRGDAPRNRGTTPGNGNGKGNGQSHKGNWSYGNSGITESKGSGSGGRGTSTDSDRIGTDENESITDRNNNEDMVRHTITDGNGNGKIKKGNDAFFRRMSRTSVLRQEEITHGNGPNSQTIPITDSNAPNFFANSTLPSNVEELPANALRIEDERWHSPWLESLLTLPATANWPRLMSLPHPNAVGTLGHDVIARIERRRELDPLVPKSQKKLRYWQKLVYVRAYEIDASGKLCWSTVLVSTPRQVGKSVMLRELALDRISQYEHFGEAQLALHIAKDAYIANEVQLPARQWAAIMERQGLPWHPVGGVGNWAVEYEGFLGRWLIRSKFGVYGYSASLAIVDEAWHLEQSVVEDGIEPTMIEREQSQLWLFSTAHSEATDLMRNKRAWGIDTIESPEDTLIIEWSAKPDASRFDKRAMREASPFWDERREKFLSTRTGQLGFEEQWLNIWPKEKSAPGWISADTWNESAIPTASLPNDSRRDNGLTFCIYPDNLQIDWYVMAAWREGDPDKDTDRIRLLEVGIMNARKDAIALVADQTKGRPAALIIPRVLRGRIPKIAGIRNLVLAGESDLAAATTSVRPMIQNGRIGHTGSERLTDHILRGVTEKWGDTLRLSGKLSGGPIEMAKASVLAIWWADRDEKRKGVVA